MRHIHLDPLGGVAGDMFAAALLDAFPAHAQDAARAAALLSGVPCRLAAHDDGTLTGRRFLVDAAGGDHGHDHHHDHDHDDHHGHAAHDGHHGTAHAHPRESDGAGSWRALRARIEAAGLPAEVLRHALGIFGCLAEAEGRVHGVAADAVTFHEVGAADSVADIVAAAWVIAAIGPATWSVGALPLGGGTVRTAHGPMPVPAPATALLLEGFAVRDDGVGGERVTPTGAAILRHLGCAGAARPRTATLQGSGIGFGSRVLPGMSNCLRALVLDTAAPDGAPAEAAPGHRALAVIAFEVDDQSGEELAAGLDQLRGLDGVHDVVQMAAFGKKNRMAVHVQVLVRPDRLDAAVEACFRETTTIGLRTHLVQGRALPRRFAEIPVDGHAVAVKLVERPGGVTAKAESDSLRQVAGHAARTGLRRAAERKAEAE
ncbi:MAG: LarC family nickel insertion protein [Janthinobacterium lividum]